MTVTARYSLFAFGVSLYRRVYETADSHDADPRRPVDPLGEPA
jgi:hypothetical protein